LIPWKGVAGLHKSLLDGSKITTDEILCQGKRDAGLHGILRTAQYAYQGLRHLFSWCEQKDEFVSQSREETLNAMKGVVVPSALVIAGQELLYLKTVFMKEVEALIVCIGTDVIISFMGISGVRKSQGTSTEKKEFDPFLPERQIGNTQDKNPAGIDETAESIHDKIHRRWKMFQNLQEEDDVEPPAFKRKCRTHKIEGLYGYFECLP